MCIRDRLYPNPDYYQWAMVEKATGQVFGSISVYNALLGEPQQKAKWPGLEPVSYTHLDVYKRQSTKRVAFHSLLAKLRAASTFFSI